MEETKGHCKHGEFDLREGCPDCIQEERERRELEAEGETTLLETSEAEQRGAGVEEPLFPNILPADQTALIKIAPEQSEGYIKLLAETTTLLEYSNKLVIKNLDDKKAATNDLIIMGELGKKIAVMKKEWLVPIDEHRKAVFDMFKQLDEPLVQAVRQTKAVMTGYDQEQDRIRREQEAINREKQALAEREAAVSGQPVEPVELVEVAPEVSTTTRTDLGSVSQRDNWKYQVEDFAALPDEFKVADTAMLNTIAKKYHDKKQIPGVRFYNDPILTRRAG